MVKTQRMRWIPRGAHLLLQVRANVLNGDLHGAFRRWHPGFGGAKDVNSRLSTPSIWLLSRPCAPGSQDTATTPSGYDAVGTVKQIDVTTGKVTIAHEAIAGLNWPAMTMIFTIKNKAFFDKLSLEKRAEFKAARIGILANHILVGIPGGVPQQRYDEQQTAE
jgi:Cu/Ag efflux protein CusF